TRRTDVGRKYAGANNILLCVGRRTRGSGIEHVPRSMRTNKQPTKNATSSKSGIRMRNHSAGLSDPVYIEKSRRQTHSFRNSILLGSAFRCLQTYLPTVQRSAA